MPRPCAIVAVVVLCLGTAAPCLQAQDSPGFSVELGLEPSMSPEQKIADLQQKIAEKQSLGQLTPELGDLFNDLGVLFAQQGQWPEARTSFIQAVQAKSFDPDIHRNLALVAIELEDYDLALAELEEYRSRGGPRALDAPRRLAQVYLKLNDVAGARAAYEQGLAELGRTPSAEVCRLALGLAGLENEFGDPQTVRRVLETWQPVARAWREKAAAEGTDDGVPQAEAIENNLLSQFIDDGQLMEDSGLPGEAAALYEKAYDLAPDRYEILPRLIGAYLAAGETMQARVKARLAREEHPDQAAAWVASAKVYESELQPQEALAAYKRAYDLAPEMPGLRLKLGNLYMKQGMDAEARRYLAAAIDSPDTPTEVVYNYAVSLMREQKYSAALVPLRRVTREMPEFAGGWQALAQCYRARKQFPEAVAAYERSLALAPDASVAYNLGVTAGRAKDWDRAVQAYDQTLALDPSNLEAAYNRAVALMQAGRLEEADAAFTAFRERNPDHDRAALNHGVTLYKLGRYADAVEVYNIALELKETAEAWDNLGLAYQQLGNQKQAQNCFRQAKALRGKS
ncbi:MAG: tetratricopeptide repeat protein [Candidatus Krumholzibacteriia bacterium]